MADLEYLSLSKTQRILYKIKKGFKSFFLSIGSFFKRLPLLLWKYLKKIFGVIPSLFTYFKYGGWSTRVSFLIFGFGNFRYKQIFRGLFFFLYQVAFWLYMVFFGWKYLSKIGTLGTIEAKKTEYGYILPGYDHSFYILLFSILSIVIILCTIYLWYQSIKQAYYNYEMHQINKKLETGKDDLRQMGNKNYHRTLLAFPMLGMVTFTVIPLIFMIAVAFTNFDAEHYPPNKLFGWNGIENFKTLFNGSGGFGQASLFANTFKVVLIWTLVWAVLATFSNFFLGMLVAMIINKKGIKLKGVWRAILVTTMAVPQFISLLLMRNMLLSGGFNGIYNALLMSMGVDPISFLSNPRIAKVTVLVVNLWIGIPYTVLTTTGILMNIPSDLYEAAKIDGANPYRMYTNITLPYIMFVMAPSLITTFIGNLNNFNVIYLLTGSNASLTDTALHPKAQRTSLLITWLYELTVNDQAKRYGLASVIGLIMFIICAISSLLVYSRSKSFKNEEDFQ